MPTSTSAAIVFIVFNRPNTTSIALKALAAVQPQKLFIVADGPRATRAADQENCGRVRELCDQIDWPCVVQRNYSDINLGCRRRVSSGISWALEQVDRAIILEDDCVPDPSFFRFCDELLERYTDDQRIMAISGNNFQPRQPSGEYSYYFSRYPHCWGWATWRRAWKHYDDAMSHWPLARDNGWLNGILEDTASRRYWRTIFNQTAAGTFDSWAYRWTLSCWLQNGLAILPDRNLVSNIGFGEAATHTTGRDSNAEIRSHSIAFPLLHPPCVTRSVIEDAITEQRIFTGGPIRRLRRSAGSILKHFGT